MKRMCCIVAVVFVWGTAVMAQEMLTDTSFASGTPAATVKGWRLYGAMCGAIKPLTGPAPNQSAGVLLTTERGLRPDGVEAWEGCLAAPASLEVLPGRRYRFEVDARGEGALELGVFEYSWKYSEKVVGRPARTFTLTPEVQTLAFDYSPSDPAAFVRPFIRLSGWLKRAELRRASLVAQPAKGDVTLSVDHFLATPGGQIGVTVKSASYPVKLLLYGATGVCGPGGELSGSAGFVDEYKSASTRDGKPGETVSFAFPIEAKAIEGAYRLVAVDPAGGASATARFNVMPEPGAAEMIDWVKRVNLPKGSRVVFVGDSLTANFPGRNYPSVIERAFRWRFGGDVEVVNAGIGGNTIVAIQKRLDAEVIGKAPTHVFLFEGANDTKRPYNPKTGQLGNWAVPEETYVTAFRDVVARLAASKAKVIVMTMAPGEPDCIGPMDESARKMGDARNFWCQPDDVRRCVEIQKQVAAELKADVIDTNAVFNERMAARAKAGGRQYLHVDDGVHISDYGNREVALCVLRYLAAKP